MIKGESETTKGTKLPIRKAWKYLKKTKYYKYLGILEVDIINLYINSSKIRKIILVSIC